MVGPVMLTLTVDVAERPPLEPVIVAVPVPAAVTRPVALTVAAAVLLELYVVPAAVVRFCVVPSDILAVSVSCCVEPTEPRLTVAGVSVRLVTIGPVEMLPVTIAS